MEHPPSTDEAAAPQGAAASSRTPALSSPRTGLWLAGGTFVLATVYALLCHAKFLTAGFDLGIFDQAVRSYAHGLPGYVPIKGEHFVLLGDHFHPVLVLLAPLYLLWDDPRVLLVVQAALLAVSVWLVHRFTLWRTTPRAATAVAFGYALGWPVQGMVDFDFHEVAFAVPLLAWAIDALDRPRTRGTDAQLVAACLLLLTVREDMGAVVLVLGVLRAVRHRPRWVGVALAVTGVVVAVVVVRVVIPAFASSGSFAYWDYPALGDSLGDAVRTVLTRPWEVVAAFFWPLPKTLTLVAFLVPLAGLWLRSPYSLVALPLLAERFFSGRENLWTWDYHYNAPVWVILVLASVDGWSRLPARRRAAWGRWGLRLVVVVPLVGALLVPLVWQRSTELFPYGRLVNGKAYRVDAADPARARAVALVPAGVCVEASDRLAPHLTRRDRVSLPGVPQPRPDYVVLDTSLPEEGFGRYADPVQVVAQARADGYVTVFEQGTVVVLRSPEDRGPTPGCAPTAP